jgi:hypothetical protein
MVAMNSSDQFFGIEPAANTPVSAKHCHSSQVQTEGAR